MDKLFKSLLIFTLNMHLVISVNSDTGYCIENDRLTTPLLDLGYKQFYLEIYFKANWYRAAHYCRFHGMNLASLSSQEETLQLENYIKHYGLEKDSLWISGNDLMEEGKFFWLGNGRPMNYTNWKPIEPNNEGKIEHCVEMWGYHGLKWNDRPCSHEKYFVCEL